MRGLPISQEKPETRFKKLKKKKSLCFLHVGAIGIHSGRQGLEREAFGVRSAGGVG